MRFVNKLNIKIKEYKKNSEIKKIEKCITDNKEKQLEKYLSDIQHLKDIDLIGYGLCKKCSKDNC